MELKVRRYAHDECKIVFESSLETEQIDRYLLKASNEVIGDYSITSSSFWIYRNNCKNKVHHLYVIDEKKCVKQNLIELINVAKKLASFLITNLKIKTVNIIALDETLLVEVNESESSMDL